MQLAPDKFTVQSRQYVFPYHHIPYFREPDTPTVSRHMDWGLEYLCYQRHIAEAVESLNPSSVLEVGCGDGYFIGNYPRSNIRRVGIDPDKRPISFAQAFFPDVDFIATSADQISESFDVVVAIEVLEHIPDDGVQSFIYSLFQRTRPGGTILISVPSVNKPLNKKHYRHYSQNLLNAQISYAIDKPIEARFEHIYRPSPLVSAFQKLCINRIYQFEQATLNKLIWHYVWNRCRIAKQSDGAHVLAYIGLK